MRKLLSTLLISIIGINAFALGPQTNSAYVTLGQSSGSDFNDFSFNVGSYNDQAFSFGFDQSLTGTTPGFRMCTSTSTGRVTWVNVESTDITISTTNLLWSVSRSNMPPSRAYQAEVYIVDGAGNIGRSIARGNVNVTESLYDDTENTFQLPSVTNLADYLTIADAAATYLPFSGDFTSMTGLGGTSGQVFESDGAGSGTWETPEVSPQTPWTNNVDAAGFKLINLITGTATNDSVNKMQMDA
ncbi:MAG: hypothetical protein KKD01_20290, partial [Proteobacteria bacterium]|nr:hypothetical protein [Pseudomonadota bacterium]